MTNPFKEANPPLQNTENLAHPVAEKPTLNVKNVVKELMECADLDDKGLPEGFENIDPVAFVKEISKYRRKALGTSKYKNSIKTYACGNATIANTLLKVLAKAQPEVTGKVMQDAVEALQITLDYGVMGSDAFMPKLLPNGAVLIRNHHRVIGIDESPSVRLKVSNVELRSELEKVLKDIDPQAIDEESLIDFSIIHRREDETVVRTRTLPEHLSDWGQTLIFISHDMDLSASDLLTEADIASVCNNSRTGTAIIRVYADYALVYGTYRASDEYDIIVEDYFEHAFHEADDPIMVNIFQDLNKIQKSVIDRTEDLIECSDLDRPKKGIMRHYFDEIMLSKNWKSYASQKAHQINCFTPFFHQSHAQPVHYYEAMDPYWRMSTQFDHKMAVINVPMQVFTDIDDFENNFLDVVQSRLFEGLDSPPHHALILTKDIQSWYGKDYAHELDSEEAKNWIKTKADEMRKQFDETMVSDPDSDLSDVLREILTYGDAQVRLVLVFEEKPDYLELNNLMKQVSANFEGGNLSVPYMGFCQGYDDGGYDTGNAPVLLTPKELEGDDSGDDEQDDSDDAYDGGEDEE